MSAVQVQVSALEDFLVMADSELAASIEAAREALGKRVVILGHHYQRDDVIRHADLTGDSYQLSVMASQTEAEYIVFCGVHFMAESADIVGKDFQRVILPDPLYHNEEVAKFDARKTGSFFDGAIFVDGARHHAAAHVAEHAAHPGEMGLHAFVTAPFWLALAGVLAAALLYWRKSTLAATLSNALAPLRKLLENKYFFDWFNENVIARGTRLLGAGLWRGGDRALIDGALVNGSAAAVGVLAGFTRRLQTGYLYSYAFWMVIGLAVLVGWFLYRAL